MILETTIQGTLHDLTPEAKMAFNETARLFQSARRTAFRRVNEGLSRADIEPELVGLFGMSARYARDALQEAQATHSSQLELLPEYIKNTEDKIRKTERKLRQYQTGERKSRRYAIDQTIAYLRRRIAKLEAKRERWQAHLDAGTTPPVIFGSAEQFHARRKGEISHEEWQLRRRSQFWLRGERHKSGGNKQASIYIEADGCFKISIGTLPIRGKRLPYHSARLWVPEEYRGLLKSSLMDAYSIRVMKNKDAWDIHITIREKVYGKLATQAPCKTRVGGLDCNTDCLTIATISPQGNLGKRHTIWMHDLPDLRAPQAAHTISNALDSALQRLIADGASTFVVERLKFAQNHDTGHRFNRSTTKFRSTMVKLAIRKALRLGMTVVQINPAYTSIIGKYKYAASYGMSVHEAAAFVIARRGQKRDERLPKWIVKQLPLLQARLTAAAKALPTKNKKRQKLLRWARTLRGWKQKHSWSIWNIWEKASYLLS